MYVCLTAICEKDSNPCSFGENSLSVSEFELEIDSHDKALV